VSADESWLCRLDTTDTDFTSRLDALTAWEDIQNADVNQTVAAIIEQVRTRGDAALLEYTSQFDEVHASAVADLEISQARLNEALGAITREQRESLEYAAQRITEYHQHQLQDDWHYRDAGGNLLGQKLTPLDRAGLYVPGGKASYPSSVLMTALPARVAGVGEVVMVVPAPKGRLNNLVLSAAAIAGVNRVFTVGGAQAIAALAYGTETLPAVDKIVGPGNQYVASAKRQVFGKVGIDMEAGPSEILIICDGHTDPDWIAMDLFSQAEHDENAQALLLCPDGHFLDAVQESIERLLPTMERSAIIRASLAGRGALIKTRDMDEAVAVSNSLAPEHLELSVRDSQSLLSGIRHAGAVFMGTHTTESLGDYCAGPSHVLPTATTARFSSPLGVYDFQKRTSIVHCSPEGVVDLGRVASVLARGESLTAHARSAEMRLPDDSGD